MLICKNGNWPPAWCSWSSDRISTNRTVGHQLNSGLVNRNKKAREIERRQLQPFNHPQKHTLSTSYSAPPRAPASLLNTINSTENTKLPTQCHSQVGINTSKKALAPLFNSWYWHWYFFIASPATRAPLLKLATQGLILDPAAKAPIPETPPRNLILLKTPWMSQESAPTRIHSLPGSDQLTGIPICPATRTGKRERSTRMGWRLGSMQIWRWIWISGERFMGTWLLGLSPMMIEVFSSWWLWRMWNPSLVAVI